MIKVGIVSFQGAVAEHSLILEKTFTQMGLKGTVVSVRHHLEGIDALIIPGGESTTISRLLLKTNLFHAISDAAKDIPIMGTCAGCILLAKTVQGVDTLGMMHMEVERNAFGPQKQSFQCPLAIKGFSRPFHAVFIRSPVITRVWDDCRPLASLDGSIVMASEKKWLALSFHPELTPDVRIHQYFLEMI
jgi:5'-phosphate synthase pdxT subunit